MSRSDAVFAPASGRNKNPILEVLRRHAPQKRRSGLSRLFFLEIGSGPGEHVGHFVANAVGEEPVVWQASDYVPNYFDSITAHCLDALESQKAISQPIVLQPVLLDVRQQPWSVHHSQQSYWGSPKGVESRLEILQQVFEENAERKFDMVYSANMIHISHSACTSGLFIGAGSVLCSGGRLILYGPFKFGGQHTSESNQRFELSLKMMNPDYGVRNFDDLINMAQSNGLRFVEKIPMPANNFTLIFEKL